MFLNCTIKNHTLITVQGLISLSFCIEVQTVLKVNISTILRV